MHLEMSDSEGVWIFGYGSIIWRPNFQYTAKRVGFINHWRRYFFQGCTSHRGMPHTPGRVATLLPAQNSRCHGVAFYVNGRNKADILARLDDRESGYDRYEVPFYSSNGGTYQHFANALVYVATQENPLYLGPDSMAAMAQQIVAAAGFSGPNTDYLLHLAESLRGLRIEDPHVFELEQRVRRLLRKNSQAVA